MDIFLPLTALAWAVGGMLCACWLWWLDRNRREISAPVKCAVLAGWPVLMPYLLCQREDLSPGQACRKGLVWMLFLSTGFVFDAASREAASFRSRTAKALPERVAWPAEPQPVFEEPAAPEPEPPIPAAPSEDDKRLAIRHWNAGIIAYQKGDYEQTWMRWSECHQLDPGNSDCLVGLQRIQQNDGFRPMSATRTSGAASLRARRSASARSRAAAATGP